MTHTPTPWKITGATLVYSNGSETGGTVCVCGEPRETTVVEYRRTEPWKPGFEEAAANAAFIVKAVNSHEALVEALREVRRRSGLLMHQNIGRWDMRVEHDKRSSDVTATNIEIISSALSEIEKGEEAWLETNR